MCTRKPYSSDLTDNEWAFVAPYLILMTEAAPQRSVFHARNFQRLALDGTRGRTLAHDRKRSVAVARCLRVDTPLDYGRLL